MFLGKVLRVVIAILREVIMMKRKYVVCITLFTLLSVITVWFNSEDDNVLKRNQIEKQTYAVSPPTTVSPTMNGKKEKEKKRKIKSVSVIDETGKNCKLKLGKLDEKDVGVGFRSSDFIDASQISNGHYYYLHTGEGGKYTIYQDQRNEVGHFFVREGTVIGFAKAGTDFFANIMYVEENPVTFDVENISYDIVRINLATEGFEVLLENCAEGTDVGDERIDVDDIMFYRGSMYYDSRTDAQWEPGGGYEPGTFLISRKLDNIAQEKKMTCTKQMNEAKPYLTFVDGKILYGRQKGKVVSLYMFDLETREQTELIRYKRKKAYIRYSTYSNDSVLLFVDDDYIYCQDMAIPRKGGKIRPLLKDALRYSYGEVAFSSNKKYIFYLDNKYKLHRIDKKTGKDILISEKKLMSVQCMENQIYVKELRHGYWDEKEENRPDILYCMSLDGTVKWKHTLKSNNETEMDFGSND